MILALLLASLLAFGLALFARLRVRLFGRIFVGVLRRFVTRAERWKRLAVCEAGGVLGFVESDRPEVLCWDVRRQTDAISVPPDNGVPVLSMKAIMYFAPSPGTCEIMPGLME